MSARRLLLAISGLIVWSSAFVVLYAALSVGCAAGVHHLQLGAIDALTALLLALFLAHLAGLAGLQWYALVGWRKRRNPSRSNGFLAVLFCLVTAASTVSLFFIGLPLLLVPPCV
ncbi:MAG: hypothetical protein ACNA7W_18525 [Pseudomonadales bacterium]